MATREETKKMIEVMQAFVDGKQIEASYGFREDHWYDEDSPDWDWTVHNYRIKVHEHEHEPKFKVGDYVRILDGSKIEDYRHGWTDGMGKYIGFIFKIESVLERYGVFCYTSADTCSSYIYDERGLELVEINNQ